MKQNQAFSKTACDSNHTDAPPNTHDGEESLLGGGRIFQEALKLSIQDVEILFVQ